MLLIDAREMIQGPRRYTLTLEVDHDLYSVHYRDHQFILAVMHSREDSRRIVEESNWQAFLAKIPEDLKASNRWMKQ